MKNIADYKEEVNKEVSLRNKLIIYKINSRAYVYGNVIQIKEYGQPVWKGFDNNGGRKMKDLKVTCKENRAVAVNRIMNDLRRLVGNNFNNGSKFITLTFKENVTDLTVANRKFAKFIMRLKYEEQKRIDAGRKYDFKEFKYLAVIEFQKRGAIHYHMISNLEYLKNSDLRKIWSNGFVKINRIKHVDNVGVYIIKYINKDLDDARLHGRKAYLRSLNLEWPEEFINERARDIVEKYELLDGDETYYKRYKTKYHGTVTLREFNLNQSPAGRKAREKLSGK